jgi:hypothetical protein
MFKNKVLFTNFEHRKLTEQQLSCQFRPPLGEGSAYVGLKGVKWKTGLEVLSLLEKKDAITRRSTAHISPLLVI